ncbi:MAG: hypothetical protein L3J22_04590 [Xanthomonadales bacterium]|nr:hypothetical protein [Xanthomonadales bacterium]
MLKNTARFDAGLVCDQYIPVMNRLTLGRSGQEVYDLGLATVAEHKSKVMALEQAA